MQDNITENAATFLKAKLPSETESEDEVVLLPWLSLLSLPSDDTGDPIQF